MNNKNFWTRNEGVIVRTGGTILVTATTLCINWIAGRIKNKRFKEREKLKWKLRKEFVREQEEKRKHAENQDPENIQKRLDLEVKQEVFRNYRLSDVSTPGYEQIVNDRVRLASGSQPLVGRLVRQGELCVLVSSTGNGKSLLAAQMAIAVASGKTMFATDPEHQEPQIVKYFDAELTDDDRKDRYVNLDENNLNNLLYYPRQSFRTVYYLLEKIYKELLSHGFNKNTMLVLDNIMTMVPKMTSEELWYLFQAMTKIQDMFKQNGAALTIIIVNHTVKNPKKNTDSDDIAGNANISRRATRTIFIGDTDNKDIKVIYVDKNRGNDTGKHYVKIEDKPYVHFEEISDAEKAALSGKEAKSPSKKGKGNPGLPDEIVQKMRELKAQGYDIPGICKEINKSYPTVQRYWKKFEREECGIR